jgi:hypothetical protein
LSEGTVRRDIPGQTQQQETLSNNWMQLTGSARCEVGSRRPRS